MTVKGCVLGKNFIKEDTPKKNFTKSIYIKNLSEIDEGIEEFKKFFYINNKKDWKDFIVKPEFLKVQFKVVYDILMENFNNSNSHIGSNYVEILCEKEEWIKKYFFEEGFNKVWKSSNKAGMRGIYRGILSNHFESFINKRNYEWNLLDDGHLYVLKRNNIYEFMYDKVEEKVTLSSKEYLNLLKELLDLYMNKYFCTLSEKEKWKTLKEKAESIV